MEELLPWLFGGGMLLTAIITIVSVICAVAIPVAIVGAVFYFLRQSAKKSEATNRAAQSWPSTSGTVIKSRAEVSGGDHTSVSPHVVYQYEVGGVSYQNNQLKAGWGSAYSAYGSAYQVIDQYPEGAAVTVYYNPMNPAESALEL
jgi:hypothetical protein